MSGPGPATRDIFLRPGEWYFGSGAVRLRTTLGSCVAIVLWHPRLKLGGMCHYMLPNRSDRGSQPLNGRYADEALELLLGEVRRSHTQPGDYEFKLFGGANMFPSGQRRPDDVPARNVAEALALMHELGLPVKAQSLGGEGYRQLVFDLESGALWMRQGHEPAPHGAP